MSIKVGDEIRTWFSGQKDGKSTVLAIRPYKGAYPKAFNPILTLTAKRSVMGSVELPYQDDSL